jgi:hypothetical protein
MRLSPEISYFTNFVSNPAERDGEASSGSDQNSLSKETKMAESRVDKIRVGVINASNFIKKDLENKHLKIGDIIDALQEQLDNHFRPAWGIQAEVELIDDAGPDN